MRRPRTARVWLFSVVAIVLIFSQVNFIAGSQVNSVATQPASTNTSANSSLNLLQYDWPQLQGDDSFTRFSAGPAPDTGDIMWKTNITGIQSYISAFNGKVFVCTKTTVFALDKDTGGIVWNTTVPSPGRWPAVYKIDEIHMVVGNSCLDIQTGRILWNSTSFSANAANFAGGAYSSDSKMFFVKTQSFTQGWDFSNPSHPPTLVWQTYVPGGGSVGSGVQYGDGIVFPGTFEHHQMALNATTGDILWDVETKGAMLFSGAYSDGRFMRGCPFDNTFYCFNTTNGDILWTFNPSTDNGYWCSGIAVSYGTVYALNKDGHLYALDVETGQLVWKYTGTGPFFFPGNPIVAEGKVYATTGQNASYNPEIGTNCNSEFVCLDAYSGGVIWKLPIEAFQPRESTCVAYGNLYLIPAYIKEVQMDDYYIINQIWAIGSSNGWPMWRADVSHSAAGQSGPTNLTLRWTFTADGAVVSSPSAVNDRVYFGSEDKNIYCVDADTGSLYWKFNTSARILSSPAVVDGRVYEGPDDGNIYCLDAYTGKLMWSTPAGGYVEAPSSSSVILHPSPTVVDNHVYVGSLDKNVYCLNANDGSVKWAYKTNGSITSSPAVVNGVVYITSPEPTSGALYMLNAKNGSLIRRIAIPYQVANQGTDMHSSPSVAEDMVYVAANKQTYYAINVTTGNVVWTFRDPTAGEFIICSPICNAGIVYLVDEFFIVALNASNGSILWKSFLGTEFYVSPTYADGKLYITSDQRGLYVIDATNGDKLGWFGTASNSWSSPTIYKGKAYVGNNDWNVYCLSDAPRLTSTVKFDLNKSQIILGDSMNGSGVLVPGKPDANVSLHFMNPNGAVDDLQVVTTKRGAFNFTYIPSKVGNWTVTAVWNSDKEYWGSAHSSYMELEVVPPEGPHVDGGGVTTWPPVEFYYILAIAIVSVIVTVAVLALKKRRK